MVFFLVFTIFTCIYILFLLWIYIGLKCSIAPLSGSVPEPVSIIIPARNEAHNLPRLLSSITLLEVPPDDYEIIIVNDHSTDDSAEILASWDGTYKIKVIEFTGEIPGLVGKKAAIQMGIDQAQYDVLAFTDADCQLPPAWLKEIQNSMSPDTDYLLGYSMIKRDEEDTDIRQVNFERSVYYALAAAGMYFKTPFTSSACNMVYRKSVFRTAGGFGTIGHLLSGDDDLLLMKMMPYIRRAKYNPRPLMQVISYSGRDMIKTHNTNIRRASKFRYHPWYVKLASVFIFIYFTMFYWALGKILLLPGQDMLFLPVILKTVAELMLCLNHLKMLHLSRLGILYFSQILLFPAQFIFYAIRGSLGKYRWK